ncbi:winged helix-turn-helix transcriptional regulator [Candidatus Fermentibacterales bacterium]|nr:winged helix-turn-helix transcriptional regulator [Candidatus Fermentibacterales bacterium]
MPDLRKQAEIIRAMGSPSRLLIVQELARREMSVGEVTALVGSDMSTVSRHLGVLRQVGIVSCRREGTTILYRLDTPCVLGFLSCVKEVLEGSCEAGSP